MKIFQIVDKKCYWDATSQVHSIEQANRMYPSDILFVEAPNFVNEGWGYDDSKEKDDRFIKPETPEGWEYDPISGTFYKIRTPAENREFAYNYSPMIDINARTVFELNDPNLVVTESVKTVTGASQVWMYYMSEGNTTKADDLQMLIAEAKLKIREKYPNEEVV